MSAYIKAVKQLRTARGFWEPEETRTFIGNVIFVCLQLPPLLICFTLTVVVSARPECGGCSPQDCSSERLRFITKGGRLSLLFAPGAK